MSTSLEQFEALAARRRREEDANARERGAFAARQRYTRRLTLQYLRGYYPSMSARSLELRRIALAAYLANPA